MSTESPDAKRSRLRLRITLALVFGSALTAVFVLAGAMWIISGIIDRADERELRSHYDALQSRLGQESRRAAAMSAVVAGIPAVQDAFARGDRDALMRLLGAEFATLKSDYGVEQVQFHTAPATSFLRVHQPAKFGDDLSSFRKTVLDANANHAKVLGLEGGVAGLGIRGVLPVSHDGAQIGTIEFGLSFGQSFFDEFKKSRGVDVAFRIAGSNGEHKTLGDTLGGQTFFAPDDLRAAEKDTFVIHQGAIGDKPVAALLAPIKDFSGTSIGAVEIVMDNSEYAAALSRARMLALGAALLGLLSAVVLGSLVARGISRPIQAITAAMRALAGGNLDVALPARGRTDEVGRMAEAVAVFKDNALRMRELQADQERAKRQGDLDRRQAFAELADNFETSVLGIVNEVSTAADAMQTTASSLSSIAETAQQNALQVKSSCGQASENVQTVAAAAEELSSSIVEINRGLSKSAEVVHKAAAEGSQTTERVQRLSGAAERIGEIVEIISAIASQTNLLALNATIEAARAGEAGRGFSVVATEVKSLASQTAKATDDIGKQIAAVQAETAGVVDAIRAICGTIAEVEAISTTIADAIREQGTATQEIAMNVQQTASRTSEVSSSISDVASGVVHTGQAAQEMRGSAVDLSRQSVTLRDEVHRFLAKVRSA